MDIQEQYDQTVGKLLMLALSFQLSTNFFGSILVSMGISTIYSTYLIYGLFLLQLLGAILRLHRECNLGGLVLLYFLMGTIIIINYNFFPKSQIYFRENMQSFLFMAAVYITVAHLSTKILSWKPFIEQMKPLSVITPIAGIVCYYFLNITQMITYMQFSNMVLPGTMLAWYYYKKEGSIWWLIASIVDSFLIVIYGGRMSMLSVLVFAVFLTFFIERARKHTTKEMLYLFGIFVAGVVVYFNADAILLSMASVIEKGGYQGSHIARKILSGNILASSTRDVIYEEAIYQIKNMGLNVYGLFGDRIRLDTFGHVGGYTTNYVHNIFLELLLSFGWIIGSICIIALMYRIVTRLFTKNNEYSTVVFALCCMFFLRLLVSSSFLIEGGFVLLLGVLHNRYYRYDITEVDEY